MKILVIGNGFDLDHGLPTSYKEFINFCNCVVSIGVQPIDDFDLTTKQLEYINFLEKNHDLCNRFKKLLYKNGLLNCFTAQNEKYNWVDLEREIFRIINEVKNVEQELKVSNVNEIELLNNHRIVEVLEQLNISIMRFGRIGIEGLEALRVSLENWLNNFSKALELYVFYFINKTEIYGVSPDVLDFDADKIITFNYSNTYERIYGGVHWHEDIHYIHGVASRISNDEHSNIILGITSENAYKDSNYAEFEKYYQRITKKTGNKYKKWLETKEKEVEIAFFGHSLDPSDSDIIQDLIYCDKSKITIYYYNTKAYRDIVSNLIEVIGRDDLIEFVSGHNPKIEFVKQKEHQNDNTGGIEITRDIRTMYQLYNKSNVEINKLINKIKQKVELKDLNYFHSQRKAISLFDALVSNQLSLYSVDEYLSACDGLAYEKNGDSLVVYKDEEWSDYTHEGEMPCAFETSLLIDAFNKSNLKKIAKEKRTNPFLYIAELESCDVIKNELIKACAQKEYSERYWKQIDELIECFGNGELFKKAIDSIDVDKLDMITRIRFLHLKDLYDVNRWNLYQLERYNDEGPFE